MLKSAGKFYVPVMDIFFPQNEEKPGFPLSWRKLEHIRFLPHALTVWTGFNGHGKSLFLNQVALDAIAAGEKVIIASFEMPAFKTLYRIVRQATGKAKPDMQEIDGCLEWLDPNLWIYDRLGTANVREMGEVFKKGISEFGISQIVVDSLMKCGIDVDDLNRQKKFVDDLQNFVQKHHAHIHLVAHARKDRDENIPPGKMDVKGAGEITDIADNVFTVWRNKPKERSLAEGKSDKRNESDAVLDCSKFREDGELEGRYTFYYHRGSMQYLEKYNGDPKIYFAANQG